MNMGGGGRWESGGYIISDLYGSDPGTANDPIQMIYYPTANDPIQAQIFSLVKNWNGMYKWTESENDLKPRETKFLRLLIFEQILSSCFTKKSSIKQNSATFNRHLYFYLMFNLLTLFQRRFIIIQITFLISFFLFVYIYLRDLKINDDLRLVSLS